MTEKMIIETDRLILRRFCKEDLQDLYEYLSDEETVRFEPYHPMDMKASINSTRKGFEESFAAGDFYNRQTRDSGHLKKILDFVRICKGMRILDLGTGSGYLSFPIAENHPGCEVIGLDIVNDALEANRMRADAEGIKNLAFISYDGIDFPFEKDSFDLVVTRYALHHFPDIDHSIGEVSRVLKKGGSLFISDPCPNGSDTARFIDDYMRLKKDGHIKFYTKDEWKSICGNHNMDPVDDFESSIRVPRKKDTAYGYEEVLKKHDKDVTDSYDLVETDTELYITERVNNILFVKKQILSPSFFAGGKNTGKKQGGCCEKICHAGCYAGCL